MGRLTIIALVRKEGRTGYWVNCRCDCGTVKEIRLGSMSPKGHTQSCGCLGKQRRLEANTGNTYMRLPAGENARNRLIHRYRRGAIERNLFWDLTREEFFKLCLAPCHYCDLPASNKWTPGNAHGSVVYSGIDRVDNEKGYTRGNCVPCCASCNYKKNSVTRRIIERASRFLAAGVEHSSLSLTTLEQPNEDLASGPIPS